MDENQKIVVLRASVQPFFDLRPLLVIVFQCESDYEDHRVLLTTLDVNIGRPEFHSEHFGIFDFLMPLDRVLCLEDTEWILEKIARLRGSSDAFRAQDSYPVESECAESVFGA